MNIRTFAPADYPAIAGIHNSLGIVWPEAPRTPEGWAQSDRSRNPKYPSRRWVAETGGQVVGLGAFWQYSLDFHPPWFHVNVEVSPSHQRQGIGAALYDQVMAGLQPFDPHILRADAFANLPQGFRFLQQRGFYEAFRETPVHLDIASFDPSPYAGLEARLLDKGIVLKSLRELASDPDRDRKTYDLYWQITEDVPQEETRIVAPDLHEWVEWGLNDPTILPDAYYIAVSGGEYVGLSELGKDPDNDVLQCGLLGVRRPYRRHGIALTLQLRGIAYGQEHGHPVLKTCTAIQNAPMQALFDKLSFARDPEWQQCQKDMSK